jgi:hypothetical protein
MQTSDSAFYIDMRDGTVEQHLSSGEVRTFPLSSGKSVSGLTALYRENARHRAIVGSTRGGMSAFLTLASRKARQPRGACSRLLVSLLSRG